MKVLDIILEAPKLDPRVLSDDQIMGLLQQAIKANPGAVKNMAEDEMFKDMGYFARNRALAESAETALNARYGILKKSFVAARIFVPMVQWYTKMLALNELAKMKDANGEYKYSDGSLSSRRNEITGIMCVQYILPLMAQGAVKGVLGIFFKELFIAIARNIGGKGGGWAVFAAGILSSAGWLAFSAWLGTSSGEAWIREWLPQFIINGMGAIANMPIDWILKQVKGLGLGDPDPAPDVTDRLNTAPDLSAPAFDIDKQRAKDRAGSRIPSSTFTTNIDYDHNGHNY